MSFDKKQRHQEYMKEYYQKHKETIKERARKWCKEHREQKRRTAKEWRDKNRERLNQKLREWRRKNPEKMKRYSYNYHLRLSEKIEKGLEDSRRTALANRIYYLYKLCHRILENPDSTEKAKQEAKETLAFIKETWGFK